MKSFVMHIDDVLSGLVELLAMAGRAGQGGAEFVLCVVVGQVARGLIVGRNLKKGSKSWNLNLGRPTRIKPREEVSHGLLTWEEDLRGLN